MAILNPLTAIRNLVHRESKAGEEKEQRRSSSELEMRSESSSRRNLPSENATPSVMETAIFLRMKANIPFLMTGLVALTAILVAFGHSLRAKPSNYTWYLIYSNFVFFNGTTFAVLSGHAANLRFVLLALTTSFFTLVTKEINDHIYLKGNSSKVIGASFIAMNLVWFLWILIFGIESGPMALNGGDSTGVLARRHIQKRKLGDDFERRGRKRTGGEQQGRNSRYRRDSSEYSSSIPTDIVVVSPNAVYSNKAQAKYSYNASASDPNELSFREGDILDVSDKTGKWWQVRNSVGVVGIAPSNYLELKYAG